ncbi:MAG TPA: type II toxin-antitoxin system RelE/ParE family toxin [Polyangiaceae bacterium]|nr:type II toxin-antitoxin system RelE/ParE family toxin [Polyangiaceae bacterium]
MARAYRLAPAAQAELDAHLAWLDEHTAGAATRFVGAVENTLETLASGVADGRPVTLAEQEAKRHVPTGKGEDETPGDDGWLARPR